MHKYNPIKAIQLLLWLTQQFGGRIDKMKAIKLIWLADRLQMRSLGGAISNDIYYAMPLGPVPTNIYNLSKQAEKRADIQALFNEAILVEDNKIFVAKQAADLGFFSEADINSLQIVVNNFGQLSGLELSDLSHTYPEWKRFENELAKTKSSYKMDFADFFKNPEQENHAIFNEPADLLSLCADVFQENQELANLI